MIFFLYMTLPSVSAFCQTDADTLPDAQFYSITEAYLFRNDSTYTLNDLFVDPQAGILIMKKGDSCVISIDRGGIDNVQ